MWPTTRQTGNRILGRSSRVAAVALVIIIPFALSGCSSPTYPGTPPKSWASTMCSAMSGWVASTQQATTGAHAQIQSAPDPATAVHDYEALFNSEINLTQQLVEKVSSAGNPAIKDGSNFAKGFISAITSYQASLKSALASLQSVSGGTQSQISTELGNVQKALNQASSTLSQRFQSLYTNYNTPDDAPLIKAITSNGNCKSIAKS